MKNIRISFLALILLFFSSCFDTIEEFTINEDGSGEFSVTMDMFKMFEMISSMGGEDKLKKDKDYETVKDSSFVFGDYLSQSEDLNEEEKRLFSKGRFHMHMSLKEKSSFMKYSFPVSSRSDFARVYEGSARALAAVGKQFSPADSSGGDAAAGKGPKSGSSMLMPQAGASNDVFRGGDFFKLENSDGLFSKKVRKEAMQAYLEKDSTLKQMLPMMGNAYAITIVHLPRPVKKVDHPMATLSGDRKTVTLKISMTDYIERPELMDFRVEY